jgi:D-threo-aldose 1-dehydrogenase
MPNPVPTTDVTLGASFLGTRDEPAALADAMIASPYAVDTSNAYAAGASERTLGEAIARAGGLPDGKLIYSKADQDPETGRFDGDRIRRSLDESLERLGLDRLPIYHLHDPYTISFAEAMAPGGAVPALIELRESGVIGAIGIASGTMAQVHEYVASGVFDAVLSHNRFTLVDRMAQPTFELARSLGMTVFNAAPFGGGTLANGSTTYGYHTPPADFAAHLDRVRALAEEHGVPLAAAALRFSLDSDLVDTTVVGITTLERLGALDELLGTPVPEEFFAAVEALGAPPASGND